MSLNAQGRGGKRAALLAYDPAAAHRLDALAQEREQIDALAASLAARRRRVAREMRLVRRQLLAPVDAALRCETEAAA